VSLRTRLALVVALVVAAVLAVRAVLQVQLFERHVERQAHERVEASVRQLADALSQLEWPAPRADLHDMVEAIAEQPGLERVTVLPSPDARERFPEVTSGASISVDEHSLAGLVLRSGALQTAGRRQDRTMAGAPVLHQGRAVAAVVVTASLEDARTLVDTERRLTPWFALGAAALITAGLYWAARGLLEQPIARLLDAMRRAGEGDLHARARLARSDELGRLSAGLDDMLDRMRDLDAAQRQRIEEATRELRKSNDDLVGSYQKMFALREALARAEQTAAAGQTAANLAHQVGTPLNLISGYVQMMLEDPDVDARQVERLRTVQEQIKKVTGYIRATLDHVRLPSAKREPVFPGAMLRRIVDVSRPRLHASGIGLTLDVPDELPWLLGDPVRLELALLNLIKNSLDAMPGGGHVRVTARAEAGGTVIEVADTGPGIPEDLGHRIFEPWVTTKPVGEGTGLGLAFTREVVLAHGGTIDVQNAPGQGATFIIGLPGKAGSPAIHEV
jgi:signal transduction histidine kinase